jgi:hypothetical protein
MSFLTVPVTISSIFGQRRMIDTIKVDVIINENTTDTLTITKQPVQQGSSITDHAYKEPTSLSMSIRFRDNRLNFTGSTTLSQIYQKLLDLQSSRTPFTVTTPKRIYKNMLIAAIGLVTDKNTENTLAINMTFQEVILVQVSLVQVPRSKQKTPGKTGATEKAGQKSSFLNQLVSAGKVLAGRVP